MQEVLSGDITFPLATQFPQVLEVPVETWPDGQRTQEVVPLSFTSL